VNVDLRKRWKVTEALFNRAILGLPTLSPTERVAVDGLIVEAREFLAHNELGLALDDIAAAAALAPCRGRVWRDLERAAEVMGLPERASEFHARFLAAINCKGDPEGSDA
jgi:hypothetical protein